MSAKPFSTLRFPIILLTALLIPLASFALDETDTELDQNQWEMAGFNESETKISEHSAYKPLKRVLVASASSELLASMAEVLPEVEFVSSNNAGNEPNNFDAIFMRCGQVDLLEKAPELAWIQIYSAGIDDCTHRDKIVDLYNSEKSVIITNSSGTAASVIGEHTIAMMMSVARGLHRFRDTQANSSWQRQLSNEPGLMNTIGGKTMLILGLGSIGTEVARRADALGMRVLATRNSSREGPDYVEYVGLTDETLTLAEQADVVVNALPLTDSTKGFVDTDFFDTLKSSAIYISVGRGGTTDTDALLAALENKTISGAALDVTDPEPLPSSHPLWEQDNVIITPHISGVGGDSIEKRETLILENLRRYQAGETILNMVDVNLGY